MCTHTHCIGYIYRERETSAHKKKDFFDFGIWKKINLKSSKLVPEIKIQTKTF